MLELGWVGGRELVACCDSERIVGLDCCGPVFELVPLPASQPLGWFYYAIIETYSSPRSLCP